MLNSIPAQAQKVSKRIFFGGHRSGVQKVERIYARFNLLTWLIWAQSGKIKIFLKNIYFILIQTAHSQKIFLSTWIIGSVFRVRGQLNVSHLKKSKCTLFILCAAHLNLGRVGTLMRIPNTGGWSNLVNMPFTAHCQQEV